MQSPTNDITFLTLALTKLRTKEKTLDNALTALKWNFGGNPPDEYYLPVYHRYFEVEKQITEMEKIIEDLEKQKDAPVTTSKVKPGELKKEISESCFVEISHKSNPSSNFDEAIGYYPGTLLRPTRKLPSAPTDEDKLWTFTFLGKNVPVFKCRVKGKDFFLAGEKDSQLSVKIILLKYLKSKIVFGHALAFVENLMSSDLEKARKMCSDVVHFYDEKLF